MEKNVFVPEAVLNFKCQMCGKCCSGWHISLKEDEYLFLQENAKEIFGHDVPVDDIASLSDSSSADQTHYAHFKFDDRGKCALVDDNNSCTWFASFGKDKGPLVCQTFPVYNFLTPLGQFYNISFYCTSAAKFMIESDLKLGAFLPENDFKPYKENMYNFSALRCVPLGLDVVLDWKAFYRLEEVVVGIYNLKDFNFFDKMFLLVDFVSLLFLGEQKVVTEEVLLSFKNVFTEKIHDFAAKEAALSGDVVYQLENIKHILNRRMALYKNEAFSEMVEQADVFLKDISVGAKVFEVKYNKCLKQFLEYEEVFSRYFFSKISYNVIMPERGVSSALKIVVCLFMLVRFFTVLRMDDGRDFKEVLISAVCDVEKYFFHDRKIFDFWSRSTVKEPCILPVDIIRMVRI